MAQVPTAEPLTHTAPPDRIAQAAGLAGAATLTSRLLGLAREQVLAALFGAGDEMDAFIAAFRIPNLVRDLFAEGAMSAAFVPTFTRQLAVRGRADAWRLGNSVLNGLLIINGALVLLGWVFAAPLVRLYVESFAAVPGKLELTILLARMMLPYLMLVATAAAAMGMLNSTRHYFVPALSPATFNVVAIVFAVAVTPLMGRVGLPRIASMAIAALVGGLAQVLVQWPLLRREGFRYRPTLDRSDPALHRVLVLMGPGTIGLAATQLNLFVTTVLAAGQGTGAVSWLQYAFRIMYLPLGLFGVSIATAVLPAAARHAASRDRSAIRETVAKGLALMLVVNVPAACGLAALSLEIVRLLYQHGHFLASDTAATAAALRFYAVGLIGYSTTRIASPVFYALGRSRVPVALSAVSVGVNVVLSLLFVRSMGFEGLALAPALAALVNGMLCLALLRRQLGGIDGWRLAATFGKVVTASAGMTVAVMTVKRSLYGFASGGATVQGIALLCSIGAGLVTLAIAARLLRIDELTSLAADARRRAQKLLDA